MLDLSVIILAKNEELHIRRCLENILPVAAEVFVIDCFSTDSTVSICREYPRVQVIQHEWPGLYAPQFNWALDNCPIRTAWVLRLDADEWFMPEALEELKEKLPALPEDVTGIIHKRRHIFLGRWMKHGVYPVKLLRLFRHGAARCEQRYMDEHIRLSRGHAVEFEHDFVDENLNDLGWWAHKHVDYASRELADLEDILSSSAADSGSGISGQAGKKRGMKERYARQPLFWRSFAYFCYRYFFKLGFLDGREGFLWHFMQGWWYRTLVDARQFEKQKNGSGKTPR